MPDCECRQIPLFFMHGGVSYIVLCSVLGSVLIVAGLYLVLWGKVKEEPDVHPDEEVGKESVPAADTGKGNKMTRLCKNRAFHENETIGFFILLYGNPKHIHGELYDGKLILDFGLM